jgi:hypothetical protein
MVDEYKRPVATTADANRRRLKSMMRVFDGHSYIMCCLNNAIPTLSAYAASSRVSLQQQQQQHPYIDLTCDFCMAGPITSEIEIAINIY